MSYIILVGVFFIVLFIFLFQFKSKSESQVVETAKKQFVREVNYMFELSSSAMIQNTYDCSYWDEFVFAIDKKNIDWIKSNITLTKSYNYEFVYVYDKNFNIIANLSEYKQKVNMFDSKDILENIVQLKKYHFFSNSNEGLMEFTFTSIHPNNDPDHITTKPKGYILVGRKLDMSYLNKMTQIFGSKVQLLPKLEDENNFAKDVISTTIKLSDWDGKIISILVFTRQLNHNFEITQNLNYFILFSILIMLLISILFVLKYIDKPLKLTTSILVSESKDSIAKLKQHPDEFGRIGELFEKFVNQKVELNFAIEKSKESDRLKSAFLANMSHEIRTPMNGILGFAELLKRPELSGLQQKQYLEVIESSGVRMLNIVNDIIDISKIESGIFEINNKIANINEQIDFLIAFFTPEITKKRLQLLYVSSLPTHEAFITTDIDKFYGVLMNLIKNAIKHTQKGVIEIGYELKGDNNQLEFFVTDSGNGIPDEKLEIIFDRFMQADMSNKTAYQGAGLGLSISKAYVEMLGGTIWVESTYGVGSTFRFTLPYTPSVVEVPNMEAISIEKMSKKSFHSKLKILIVEDDPGMEFLLTETVHDYCSELFIARDGLSALDICKQHFDIDLILMDIRIPKMDGYETTEEIRLFNSNVVIIAQTACAFSSDKDKALNAGCNDYVSKPIDAERFEQLIEQYFENSFQSL